MQNKEKKIFQFSPSRKKMKPNLISCSNPHHLCVPSSLCSGPVEQDSNKNQVFCLCWESQLHLER